MNITLKVSIFIFAFFEFMLLTFHNDHFGSLKSPLILLISSLMVGLIGLYFASFNNKFELGKGQKLKNPISLIIVSVIAIVGATAIGFQLKPIFDANPLDIYDVSQSDIIPQIGIMVNRMLEGTFPYAQINEWGYTLNPTYLPLQWLPFSLAKIFQFDYRWIPFLVLNIGILVYLFHLFRKQNNAILLILLSILPYICWYLIIFDEPDVFAHTIESLIAGYYLIMGVSLLSKKSWFIALGISLCLLSRFSLILWLPLFGIVFLISDYKQALRIGIYVIVAVIMLYVLPFLIKDPGIFTAGLAHHTKAAVGEWQPYWQLPGEKPYHLFRGVGMAAFFYEWVDGDVATRINVLQIWHLGSLIVSVFIMALYYLWRRFKILIGIFLLSTLKIYFCFFYYFIQIPYIYLMIVPFFISIILLSGILSLSSKEV